MDTPYWEQMQYIGDTRIQALISYSVAGDDRLARQAINAFNNSRIPDGITLSRYPTSMFQAIPTFSLLWVGMVHDFWMYRDDPTFVRDQLDGTRTALDWFLRHQRPDGLLDALFVVALCRLGQRLRIRHSTGRSGRRINEHGSSVRGGVAQRSGTRIRARRREPCGNVSRRGRPRRCGRQKTLLEQEYALFADTPAQKHFSQHANILAVWLDVVPREQQQEVLTRILSATDASFHRIVKFPR